MIKLLMIYFILLNLVFFEKKKLEPLGFKNWQQFWLTAVYLIFFVIMFIGVLRLSSFFRESKSIDINYYIHEFDISFLVLGFILIFLIKRNFMFLAKLSFFKMHYFGLCDKLPMNPYSEYYRFFYYLIIIDACQLLYNKFYWLNKILTLIMLVLLTRDLLFNQMLLDLSLWFAPFYGLFKFLYNCISFVALNQDIKLDWYAYNMWYIYTGFIPLDSGVFGLTFSSKTNDFNNYLANVVRNY